MKISLDQYTKIAAKQVVSIAANLGERELVLRFRSAHASISYRKIGQKDWRFLAVVENDFELTVFTDDIEIVSGNDFEISLKEGESIDFESYEDSFVMPMSRNAIDPVQERIMQRIRLQQMEIAGEMEILRRERAELDLRRVQDAINQTAQGAALAANGDNGNDAKNPVNIGAGVSGAPSVSSAVSAPAE